MGRKWGNKKCNIVEKIPGPNRQNLYIFIE